MLKYVDTMIVFAEIPSEITLAINISGCPCHCPGCHSPELWEDIGTPLTENELNKLIDSNKGISCVCFMGGDSDPKEIDTLAKIVKGYNILHNENLKVGWYSGRNQLSDYVDIHNFDYIKIGSYIEEKGPLTCPTTNQTLWMIKDNKLINITNKLQSWKI